MKRALSLLLAAAFLLGLAACGGTSGNGAGSVSPSDNEVTAPVETGTAGTRIFVDSAGREVEIPVSIERLAPSGLMAQIVVFALAPDKFVGLSNDWPEYTADFLDSKYLQLPTFGKFYGSSGLNLEALAAADPQIIIDIGEAKDTIIEDMDSIQEQLGIPTVFIEATTEAMPDCYKKLGELLGMEDEAQFLADYCDEIYTLIVDTMAEIGGENKVDALYCLGESGNSVIVRGSYHAEIIDLLTNNMAVADDPSSMGTGNEVSMEQIYNWDPEYIIFAPDSIYSTVGGDGAWQSLKAIRSGNYYEAPAGPYIWMGFPPSVNRYMGMLWLAQLLYPDHFDYNLYEEAVRYYDLFFHCELTREQFDSLTKNS